MEARPRKLQVYETLEGVAPFDDWLDALRDNVGAVRIEIRLDRLSEGNCGDSKAVGDGVVDLRVHFGPGYRLYVAEHGSEIVLLLAGGNKGSQVKDIKLAKSYWQEYKGRA